MKRSLVFLLTTILFASCNTPKQATFWNDFLVKDELAQTTNKLEYVTQLWTGHFSNKDYISNNEPATALEQEIIGRRIWLNRIGEHWLYTGWFKTDYYEAPLAHSLANITRISPDTLFIKYWGLDDDHKKKHYEWAIDKPFDDISPADLINMGDECGSYIVQEDKNTFKMIAKGPCASNISSDIQFFEIYGTLRDNGIVFKTRFLNRAKELFMQYQGNDFIRLSKEALEAKHKNTPTIN